MDGTIAERKAKNLLAELCRKAVERAFDDGIVDVSEVSFFCFVTALDSAAKPLPDIRHSLCESKLT